MATQKTTHIKNLFLDPNNYRFIDNSDYIHIENDKFFDKKIQQISYNFLEEKGLKEIEESFKENGYLPVDIIQVKELKDNKFLVVEGNRRIAILKNLWNKYEKDESVNLGKLDPTIFKEIPITYYEDVEDEAHHLVVMGLKHISGNKKWSAYNQALLVVNLQKQHQMSDEKIIKSLAISQQEFIKIKRTLALIDDYRKSEFGDQFKSSMYSIFQTLTYAPKIRYWMDLDDDMIIQNKQHRDRLFYWLSEVEEIDDETEEVSRLDRIISTSAEAKNLAKIIDDENALEEMESNRSFAQGFAISKSVKKDRLSRLLSNIEHKLDEVYELSTMIERKESDKLDILSDKIGTIIQTKKENLFTSLNQENETFMNFKSKALSKIEIIKYKKLENFKIENINRINIFAGINNAGKTSLLEAISLLLNQNDIYHFLDIQRRRAKLIKLNSLWLNNELLEDIELRGVFNYVPLVVEIQKQKEESETLNKEGYLSSIGIKSSFGDEALSSSVRLYEDKNEKHYKSIKIVCNNSYSSPFSIQNKDDLEKHYARAVQKDVLTDILDFIKEHIDPELKDIRFTKEYIETFVVNHKDFTIDLSGFGEGLQRVFYIALQFASAQNGVILIDELENGLHYTLLESFTRFMQELAIKLNVQVFLTTHSKETIEAFVSNGFENEDINFYRLTQNRRSYKINAIKYDSKLLLEELEDNQEVRGW